MVFGFPHGVEKKNEELEYNLSHTHSIYLGTLNHGMSTSGMSMYIVCMCMCIASICVSIEHVCVLYVHISIFI